MKIKQYLSEKKNTKLIKGWEVTASFPSKELQQGAIKKIKSDVKEIKESYFDGQSFSDEADTVPYGSSWSVSGGPTWDWGFDDFKNDFKTPLRQVKKIIKLYKGEIIADHSDDFVIDDLDDHNEQAKRGHPDTLKKEKEENEIYYHKEWVDFISDLKNWIKLQLTDPTWIRLIDEEVYYQKRIKTFMTKAVKTIHKDLTKIAPELEHKYDLTFEGVDNVLTRVDDYLSEVKSKSNNAVLIKNFNGWVKDHILKKELNKFLKGPALHMDWIHKDIRRFVSMAMTPVKKDFKKEATKWPAPKTKRPAPKTKRPAPKTKRPAPKTKRRRK